MEREALLLPICEAAGGVPTSTFDGWEIVPGFIDGEHACTLIANGTEVHFYAVPAWRRRLVLRERTQAFLSPLLERFGFLTTRIHNDRWGNKQRRFVERVGFKPTWADNQFQYYMLGTLPFARSES